MRGLKLISVVAFNYTEKCCLKVEGFFFACLTVEGKISKKK